MYYRDLEPYRYGLPVGLPDVVTVGWLSSSHEFSTADIDPDALTAITRLLSTHRINKMRGYHLCEICRCTQPIAVDLPSGPLKLGSAELWIPSGDYSRIYAAPDLIHHYIAAHHYAPPEEFITAALQARKHGDWDPMTERQKRVAAALPPDRND